MAKYYAWGAVVAVVLLIVGMVVFTMGGNDEKYAQCTSTKASAAIGGPFTLVDEDGKTVTDKDVIDEPSLLYFGYTFCPDVCPLDNSRNAEAIEILESQGKMVKPVFISVDPDRDTPEVLRDFTENLHPRMVGLTGSLEQVAAASKAYRTFYDKHDPEEGDEEFYLIDHSTWSYLVFPGEGTVALFKRDLTPNQMAEQMSCYLDAR
ncbi:SCO family protein [Rhodalgimonas zhirmunskyi]|uniref:SCO family protein n=1 Tax=Rhodalgimonas zhirmunskyi TaxID=2964767 RepID=A0AAJ1UAK2_9RHOB|nr:SCO family protein [Rhodoalgimonas zhirmunskyi]MDQ2094333.1 SCO family protein [Rhodoalgimonas zhirmunskyi]